MADENKLPKNVDLKWIGQTLLSMRAELRGDIAALKQMRAEDRSLLEDVAREVGLEPTPERLSREDFEKKTDKRLKKLEAKAFPSG